MRDEIRLTIVIPALAALVTGALFGLVVLAVAAWRSWPVAYAPIVATVAALVAWLTLVNRFVDLVSYRLAPTRPKAIPTQAEGPQSLELRIHQTNPGGYLEGSYTDLPVSEKDLVELAGRIVGGQSLTTSQITGSGLLSRVQWEALRDRLVSCGLLQWRNGNRQYGVVVTNRGMVVFRRMAGEDNPPSHPPARMS